MHFDRSARSGLPVLPWGALDLDSVLACPESGNVPGRGLALGTADACGCHQTPAHRSGNGPRAPRSRKARLNQENSMRVAVTDPSLFTISYDGLLCDALSRLGL